MPESTSAGPRAWGRVWTGPSTWTWVPVTPDANGDRTNIYLTNLVQVLLLIVGESPFFANYGIPAQTSVIQQIVPDFYTAKIQQQFSQYFASIVISRRNAPPANPQTPVYDCKIITKQGAKLSFTVAGNDRYQVSH